MDMASIGCYNVLDGKWEVGPTFIDQDVNPYAKYFKKSIDHLEDILPKVRNIILEPYEVAKVLRRIDESDPTY